MDVTSRSLTIRWDPPTAEYRNGVIRHYIVDVTVTDTGERLQYTPNSTSLDLNQLHPYYMYRFVIRAVTIGPGPSSEALTVQTLEEGMCS